MNSSKQFPNCWTYDDNNGFIEATHKALAEEHAQRHELSWEAATERFLKVTELDQVHAGKPSNIPQKNFMSTSFNF
ncbi:hypothetical protein I3843_02G153200 [Carya illinoinensis]|nr:hypothetical protein I3843_02G153200 [Carya illinoinensis]